MRKVQKVETYNEESNILQTARNKYFYGKGFNDIKSVNHHDLAYVAWKSMLQRCYSKSFLERNPTYIGCSVCDEWLRLSKFKEWYDKNYIPYVGLELDKDILVKGNKVYSPQTCCFVPHRINCLLQKNDALRGELPIGVTRGDWANRGEYSSMIHIYNKQISLGAFDTPEEAFHAYKRVKEAYIALEANIAYSRGYIDKRVLDALLNYEVEITD